MTAGDSLVIALGVVLVWVAWYFGDRKTKRRS